MGYEKKEAKFDPEAKFTEIRNNFFKGAMISNMIRGPLTKKRQKGYRMFA